MDRKTCLHYLYRSLVPERNWEDWFYSQLFYSSLRQAFHCNSFVSITEQRNSEHFRKYVEFGSEIYSVVHVLFLSYIRLPGHAVTRTLTDSERLFRITVFLKVFLVCDQLFIGIVICSAMTQVIPSLLFYFHQVPVLIHRFVIFQRPRRINKCRQKVPK